MPSSNTRVGTYLLWLVIAVSLPIVLFAGGTIWRAQQADRLRERQELAAIAADIAGHADSALSNLRENLLILARSPNLRNEAWDAAKPDIDAAAAQLDATIRVVGTDGRALVAPSPPESAADIGAALQDPVRRAIEAGAPEVTDLLPEVPDAARSVAVIVPGRLGREATQAAFALAAIPSRAWLQRLVQRQAPAPAGLITALFDRSGTLVARSRDPARFVGHSARSGLLKAMQGAGSGFVDTTTLEGVPAVAAFRRTTVSGYTAAALLPRSELGAARKQDLIATLAVGAGLIGAGLLAAGWLSRRLVHALHLVGHDPTASPPSFGVRELDDLAARLHAMAWEWQGSDTSLRQSEAMLRDLVQMLDQAVIMTRTLDGTIRFWSQGCVRMYGWTPQEAIGQRSHTLLQTQFPSSLTELEQALLEHGTWTGDLVHRRRDGSRIVAAAEMVLRRRQDGTPDLVMESLVDVTALREAEDRLRAINEDLEQRVQAEIDARQAAQQRAEHNDRIQALGQLAGGIAHDFNNILQAIAGGAALIARHPRDTDMVTRFIGIISDAAARGATITRRILLLARRGDLRAEPIDTPALLTEIKDIFGLSLGASITVELDAATCLPPILADRAQLETALVNLATNARDAMPEGGILRLAAAAEEVLPNAPPHPARLKPGRYIRLDVTDTGAGMDAAALARVGEPFFTTKGVGKGTGLGLSMVKGFAEQSGGGFAIASAPGRGTTASIWLPVSHIAPEPLRAEPAASRTAQILLVDDDPLVLGTVAEQLEDLGHKVLSASGGTDALAILRARQAVDLMITDLAMPGMNGLTLIREAREVRPRLPAILLTGYANELSRIAPEEPNRTNYTLIRKPASTDVLKARISELLDQG